MKNKNIDARRRYELLLARSEMLEKCRYCEPSEDQACCQAGCEIFDNVVEAIEYGLCDINPCFYCPLSRTSCFGWDSGRPNPFPVNDKKVPVNDKKVPVNDKKVPVNVPELKERIDSFRGEYFFLSNFSNYGFELEGVYYKTVEHYFQAQKCVNKKEFQQIVNAETPALARKLGRRVSLRKDWPEVKEEIMMKGVRAKFTQNPEAKELLLKTGEAELIEGNTWRDTFWGVCNGKGQNKLGKILMKIRKEVKEELKLVESRKTPKKESKTKGDGKVVMVANFSDTKSMDVDEVWILSSTQKIKIKGVNQVIDVRDTETLKIKLALLFQKVKGGTTVALVPKSEKLGAVLEKHGLVVEYFSAE